MKARGFAVIGLVAAIILAVVFLPVQPGDVEPRIIDTVVPKDSSSVEIGTTAKDKPQFEDESVLESDSQAEFFVDQNGTKHYTIEVRDVPKTGDK